VRLLRADDLVPAPAPELREYLPYSSSELPSAPRPAIDPTPEAIESDEPARTVRTRTQFITVVHAPSRIKIPVAAGHHHLKGEYGFAPAARGPGCAPRARVHIDLSSGREKSSTLYERTLDFVHVEDQRRIPFELEFDSETPASLWLSTESTTTGADSRCAWTYWKRVQIED
jgi:hypothetical protein